MENSTNQSAITRVLSSEDYIIIGVSALSVILNTLTLLAVWKCANKLSNHYLLVINQCAVDVVYSISSIAFLANWGHATYDRCTVVALWILVLVSCGLVLTNLCALTVDHFLAIYSAMRYTALVTKRRVLIGLGAMYGLYLVVVLSLTLTMFAPSVYNQTTHCLKYQKNLSFIGLNVWFGVTLLLVIAVYSYIFHKSRKVPPSSLGGTKYNLKKTWTSLWIIATFLVCFGFDVVLFFLDGVVTSKDGILVARRITRILHAINFICDPIIYAIRLPNVRKGYKKLWRSLFGNKQPLVTHSSTRTSLVNR